MLHDFQRSFASGLLKASEEEAAARDLRIDVLGFGVYAHHARASLAIAIENAFPITKRLVGAGFFAEMAGQFVAAHPPRHGWLSAYGEGFPEFVARYLLAKDLNYLPDLACIEWARVRAANAANDPGLDLKSLMSLDLVALEGLCLSLHGAATLIRSPFPVFDIWQAHQHADDEQLSLIDLAKGSQDILITRAAALEVSVSLLSPGDAAFLAAVVKNSPFGAACQAAVLAESNYDLGQRLGDLVCRRSLAAFTGEQGRG